MICDDPRSRISFPVEKGWLARQAKLDGFGSEELRQRFGDGLALLSGRPAFAYELGHLQDVCHWTSGTWRFGRDRQRRWNEL